jgi:hypothetical protein
MCDIAARLESGGTWDIRLFMVSNSIILYLWRGKCLCRCSDGNDIDIAIANQFDDTLDFLLSILLLTKWAD